VKETITLDRKDAEEIACLLDDILGADILLGENEKIADSFLTMLRDKLAGRIE
jgi:hypothetical protein